jgi:hypothetical protein
VGSSTAGSWADLDLAGLPRAVGAQQLLQYRQE